MHRLMRIGIAVAFGGLLSLVDVPDGRAQPPSPPPAPARAELGVIQPVLSCAALAGTDLAAVAGAPVTVEAALAASPRGEFCRVTGTIAPAIGFEVDLPVAKWTQRLLQTGCGGLCGTINASIGNAGTCAPATEGEFVLAATDMGHQGRMGSPTEGDFADDPQRRIDFAYRAQHLTTLVAKALIRAFYGQPQRYAYFSGCSDGGREALMEAQRFPEDFDGISAGAPAMLFQVQNSFFHAWTAAVNTRADGTRILSAPKLAVLHAAVLAHCDAADGTADGLLSDPRACRPDPAWVRCSLAAADPARCLTPEEWTAAAQLYEGPTDTMGHRFMPGGLQPGSELSWAGGPPRPMPRPDARQAPLPAPLGEGGPSPRPGPSPPGGPPGGTMLAGMAKVVYRDPVPAEADPTRFPFTTAQFARVAALHSLNDATNPDLRPFAGRGSKLILWHGWADTSIAPMISIAYYKAVQQLLGADATDGFLRLFLLPGVGHCGGGDGFAQFDTLSALMAWVETGAAPGAIVADRVPDRRMGPDGRGGGPGAPRAFAPYAQPAQPALASRPIYPFPAMAALVGGDPLRAASYAPRLPSATDTPSIEWFGAGLIAPGFQRSWTVENGRLYAQ